MMHSIYTQAEGKVRGQLLLTSCFHAVDNISYIAAFLCAYSKGSNCSWCSPTLGNGHLSLPGHVHELLWGQTEHTPLGARAVDHVYSMGLRLGRCGGLWEWEETKWCRDGGRAPGLEGTAASSGSSHSLVCLWALTRWGRYLSTDLHLVSDHLLEIQTTPSPTLGSHSHPVGQYQEMGSLMSIRSLRLIARQVSRVKQQLAWSGSLTLVFVDKRTSCKGKHGGGQMQL